jgi:hypothetical protein
MVNPNMGKSEARIVVDVKRYQRTTPSRLPQKQKNVFRGGEYPPSQPPPNPRERIWGRSINYPVTAPPKKEHVFRGGVFGTTPSRLPKKQKNVFRGGE